MSDEQLAEQIFNSFKFIEPSEEDLLEELAQITSPEKTRVPENKAKDSKEIEDPELIKELSRLSIGSSTGDENYAEAQCTTSEVELKQRALAAKKAGKVDEAKQLLLKAKQVNQLDVIDSKIEQVKEIAALGTLNNDRNNSLKLEALRLKRAGDLEGAIRLMKQASADPKVIEKSNFKELFNRLTKQAKSSLEAVKFYERVKDNKSAQLYKRRKEATEKELELLLQDFKSNKPIPEWKEERVVFFTQQINSEINEKDMLVMIDVSKSERLFTNCRLKIIFELPSSMLEHERIIELNDRQSEYKIEYKDLITRDLKQQKFFEHRRVKFELLGKEKTFFFFSSDVILAAGYVKLNPLASACNMNTDVRLTDSNNRKHSCTINVDIKLRFPVSLKDPIKHDEKFLYIPVYYASAGCEYNECVDNHKSPSINANNVDYFVSYVVIEKEIERLSAERPNQNIQLRIIELEGKRDQMQLEVATGQLDMESYIKRVQACLGSMKSDCVALKKNGDLQQAKKLLMFIRLMEDEVAEVNLEAQKK